MSTWRMAGLNYVNYSNIAAKILRKSLKAELKADAARRDDSLITISYWSDGNKLGYGTLKTTPSTKAVDVVRLWNLDSIFHLCIYNATTAIDNPLPIVLTVRNREETFRSHRNLNNNGGFLVRLVCNTNSP